jgi:transposase
METCLFVGIDTHKDSNTAAVMDSYFNTVDIITFSNRYGGFDKFMEKLSAIAGKKSMIFGLEDSQGLGFYLADYLIQKGFRLLDVNPIYTDRARKATIHRDKSDEGDAILIAKALIRERNKLSPVKIDKASIQIREMVRYRQMLVEESTRLKNRLHNLIFSQYMGIANIFSDPFSKAALAFFLKYPDPGLLLGVSEESLANLLKAHSRGRYGIDKAKSILNLLPVSMDKSLSGTRAYIIESHIKRFISLKAEMDSVNEKIKELVEKSCYSCLTSIPGIDTVTAAKIISQVIDIGRFRSASKLAKFAGIAPREKSSGRKKKHEKSKYGKKFLRSTIFYMALFHIGRTRTGMDKNSISRAYYLKKISEGKTKKEAITCLSRRLVDLIFAVMRDRSIYNFSKSKFLSKHANILDTVAS